MPNAMSIFMILGFSSLGAWACPQISGHWSCDEKSFDYQYEETFQVTQEQNVFHYFQTLKDQGGEQPTFEKISDNVVRLVDHEAIETHDYYFHQNSFCPDESTLQTHEVVTVQEKDQVLSSSTADFILKLESDGSLRMITNSVTEDGIVHLNDFVGVCHRQDQLPLSIR